MYWFPSLAADSFPWTSSHLCLNAAKWMTRKSGVQRMTSKSVLMSSRNCMALIHLLSSFVALAKVACVVSACLTHASIASRSLANHDDAKPAHHACMCSMGLASCTLHSLTMAFALGLVMSGSRRDSRFILTAVGI